MGHVTPHTTQTLLSRLEGSGSFRFDDLLTQLTRALPQFELPPRVLDLVDAAHCLVPPAPGLEELVTVSHSANGVK